MTMGVAGTLPGVFDQVGGREDKLRAWMRANNWTLKRVRLLWNCQKSYPGKVLLKDQTGKKKKDLMTPAQHAQLVYEGWPVHLLPEPSGGKSGPRRKAR